MIQAIPTGHNWPQPESVQTPNSALSKVKVSGVIPADAEGSRERERGRIDQRAIQAVFCFSDPAAHFTVIQPHGIDGIDSIDSIDSMDGVWNKNTKLYLICGKLVTLLINFILLVISISIGSTTTWFCFHQ